MRRCPKVINSTNYQIAGGLPEFADKPLYSHLQEEMSCNSSQANVRVIQGLRNIESHLTKKSSVGPKRWSKSAKTTAQVPLSSGSSNRRSARLFNKEKNVTMSAASFTAASEMVSKTKSDTLTIRSMRTGTSMGEAMFSPRPRLKRTVSFVTNLSDLDGKKQRVEQDLSSHFAACSIAPKSTTEVVWTPISRKGILTRNIGSVLDTTATPVSTLTCSTVSTVPPVHTLRANHALTTDFYLE